MSALAADIADVEAQLADARARGHTERVLRLERKLARMRGWQASERAARAATPASWSYRDPAVFRRP